MLAYVDTHCHLDLNVFDEDREAVIERAIAAGVELFINPGIDVRSTKKILELSEQFPRIKAAAGLHPNDIPENWQLAFLSLETLVTESALIAIGEIGLDRYHKQVPLDRQIEAFWAQLKLASDNNLPVIIHCREALDLIYPILRDFASTKHIKDQHGTIGVMHSFEGGSQDAQKFIELGFMIGLGGPVTYKNAHSKHELAATLPIEALVLETDSPYLTPVPYRGTRNEPSQIPQIAKRTAIIRGCSEEIVSIQTTRNAYQLFRLGEFQ